MPVYLSSQSFSAWQTYGGWFAFIVLLLCVVVYLDIVKGQGE